jgi:dTDP-4-amino-4,6-dideoxygalactose transaminase
MRLFADKGWPRDTGRHHVSFGLNYRMTELCGAVARAQLAKLPGVLAARRAAAARLVAAVGDLPGIHLPRDVESHAWWLMPVVVEPPRSAAEFAALLHGMGVPARPGYLDEPLHCAPALTEAPVYGTSRYPLSSGYGPGLCPVAEQMVSERLVVIDWNERYTDSHVDAIADAIRDAHRRTA